MKKYLIFILFVYSYTCSAQALHQYTHDNAGNRTGRVYVPQRLANPNDSTHGEDPAVKYGVNVFPNPTVDRMNISIDSLVSGENATILIFDERGRLLIEKRQSAKLDAIDLGSLAVGVYYLRININKEQLSYKIQKN